MDDVPDPQDRKIGARRRKTVVGWLISATFLLLAFLWYGALSSGDKIYDITYSRFMDLVLADQVQEVTFRGDQVEGVLKARTSVGPRGEQGTGFTSRVPPLEDATLLSALESHHVTVAAKPTSAFGFWDIVIGAIPWLLFFGILYWSYRRTSQMVGDGLGAKGRLSEFLRSGTKQVVVPDVRFADVAGQDNAKREVAELVEYLKDPKRFGRLGATAPRGVLLMGPPGTGKTLLARALAGEAGVPFYSISGSQFIEVFVGVGASRVRNLFAAAREHMPSIVFIDELDSIGRTRGTGLGGGHDEREQTLNQILAEMDGFSSQEAILVLAATNRPDILDPALLRPGRFDRHVVLDLPSRDDRKAILGVHTRKVPLSGDVDLGELASGTPGFSGADLKNMVNEGAILAARADRAQVNRKDFEEAKDKLLLGSIRRLAIQPEEKHRLAVHESGHALVAYFLAKADPLHKVTIIPRGRSLGETQQLPEKERYTLPEDYLQGRLTVMLAGRAAEHRLLGNVSSGADADIREATGLARAMVSRWGMSGEIGPMDLRVTEEAPFLGKDIAQPRTFSEHSAELVDRAVRAMLHAAEQRADAVLMRHADQMDALVRLLEEKETLDRDQVAACLMSNQNPLVSVVARG